MAPTSTFSILFLVVLSFFASSSEADNNDGEFVLYSDPPQSLLPGQRFYYDMNPHGIPFGPYAFALQPDCNLVLSSHDKAVWSSNTTLPEGKRNCYLTVLPDGEVVLRHNFHYPLWRSGVKSAPGSYAFIMTWDGKVAVYGPELWSNTKETVMSEIDPMVVNIDYVQYSHQVTPASYGIILTFKNFRLSLTQECNMVLEDMNSWKVLWQTNTKSTAGDCFTYLDDRGELFIKHKRREILWRSGKRADTPAVYPKNFCLALRYDGRIVIYHPQIWMLQTGANEAISPRSRLAGAVSQSEIM